MTLVVEADDSDESGGVSLLALLKLLQHLGRVGAPEHGQLPHGPVSPIVVPRGVVVLTVDEALLSLKFQARNPARPEQVVDFLRQLCGSQGRKVGQRLELLQPDRWPHLHALHSSTVAGERGDVIALAGDREGRGRLEAGERSHHGSLNRAGALDGGDSSRGEH
ncbi:hypothetical protein A7L73_18960 [Acinetobacter baumannii]|nr:hypothetical protein A7L73_18960 [Acinetobacter baumannii]